MWCTNGWETIHAFNNTQHSSQQKNANRNSYFHRENSGLSEWKRWKWMREKNCSNSHLKKAASLNKQAASYTWIIQNVMFISKPAMLYGYSLSLTRAATLLLLQKEKTGSSRKIHHFYDESLGNLTNLEFKMKWIINSLTKFQNSDQKLFRIELDIPNRFA